MPHLSAVVLRVTIVLIAGACADPALAADDHAFYHENVMGTSLELVVRAESRQAAIMAEERVLHEIDRLSAIFSGYDPKSELSRWQAGPRGAIEISPELCELLELSDRWTNQSRGAFDPRVEVLTRLWSRCAAEHRLPKGAEQGQALALIREPAWLLDKVAHTAKRISDCPISLNGIAKGYIVGRACSAALDKSRGVSGVLLNVGGDLRVEGDTARTVRIVSPWADSESSEPWFRSKSKTNRSPPAAGRSADCRSAASGTPMSLIHDRGCRSSGSPARLWSLPVQPMPTSWPKRAACSQRRRPFAWSILCQGPNA